MRVTPDTNLLVRVVTDDEPDQSARAAAVLQDADRLYLSLTALSELVWVLRRGYRYDTSDVAAAIRNFTNLAITRTDRRAVAAGLAMLEAGGDFADGVIAFEGWQRSQATFVSFDRKAVAVLQAQGHQAREP